MECKVKRYTVTLFDEALAIVDSLDIAIRIHNTFAKYYTKNRGGTYPVDIRDNKSGLSLF